jgi:hypothetical protein
MKYILLTIAISVSLTAYGQDCDDYTFSTHPTTAVNEQDPYHINLDFDWTAQTFDFYNLGNWGTGSLPFYQTSGNPYIAHLHESQDSDPDDGWELLFYDFGTQIKLNNNGDPVIDAVTNAYELETVATTEATNPLFVLYNRYTGIARVFARIEQQYAGYSMARIRLYFENQTTGLIQTSLINDHNTLLPLDQFFEDPSYDSPVAFINTQGKWFYTDFFMNYDPCTCDFESKLWLEVRLIEEATIDLKGQTNGDIVSVTNKATQKDEAGNAFSIGGKAVLQANTNFQKAWKAFKTSDEFRAKQFKEINEHLPTNAQKDAYKDGVNLFQQALIDNEFMRDALETVPYVSLALAFVDLFVSGGKKESSSASVKLHPMTIQSTSEYHGTITSSQLYINQSFWLPGSDNINKPVRFRPWYNKPLGIFNLMTTPQVNYDVVEYADEYEYGAMIQYIKEYSFTFVNDLDYVINYNAGFDASEFPDIEAQLVITLNKDNIAGEVFTDNSNMIEQEMDSVLITRRVPVSCVDNALNFSVTFDYTGISLPPINEISDVKVKLFVNLKRADADENTQNVLFVASYPVILNRVNGLTLPPNPYANIQDVVNLENTVVTSDIRAWQTVNIGENVIIQPQNGNLLNITAGKEVNILGGANSTQIFQKTRIKTESLFANCTNTNPPKNEAQIRSFCASNTYQKEERGFLKNANIVVDNENLKVTAQFSVSPNPTTTFVNIESEQSYRLSIFNMLGQQIRLQNGTIGTQQLNMMDLEAGIYFFAFEFEDGTRETIKVMKQ